VPHNCASDTYGHERCSVGIYGQRADALTNLAQTPRCSNRLRMSALDQPLSAVEC
jgi:hypothetical protein